MTTNDSNAILFTKTIQDLANFASLRLQYLADKVKYIDHLLPDDSDSLGRQKRFPDDPDSLGREKRMMTLIPWIICMDELKTTKASTLEDERILQREIYKYIPFPYPLTHATVFNPNYIHYVSDALSRQNDTTSSLLFIPETEMIAIGRASSLGASQFKLISNSDLASCVKRNHIFLCEKHQVLQTNLPGTCLGALYLQHEGGVIENCQLKKKTSS